jgi:chorismate mutase / prephenate dehydratase
MADRRREVEDLRRQMAEADADILRGLQRRAHLARQIGSLGPGTPISPAGEREQLALLEKMAADELPGEVVRAVFREIRAATAPLERPARVAYAGPEGGFSHVAAQRQFGLGATLVSVESVEVAIDEVTRQRTDFAVIPFESSLEGPLQTSIEALSATELLLAAKIEISAGLDVMGRASHAAEIDKLYAYAADRLACQKYVTSHPKAAVIDVRSPLAACQMCLQDPSGAAIVAEAVGQQAGLVAVETNVGDHADVRVRYGVISTRPTQRSGADTTALIFGVHDAPGALFDVLKHFAERGINLQTIHSRPRRGENWNYLFYVEVTGHVTDRGVVTALEEIKRETRLLKVLGSFPSC